ncbi:LOW QUALITY PROTEIN: WPP domain-interacting protein 1-like [Phalaenopsis equestris]|uniref:LOW QUALITY PROTEIN: WPP domain-interacting protein 1-like n=1 Tax=Phalaenopsis equestris TaxID=78828 RepID=UPI0009E1DA56|nr:LOW QUALITY PROTEIN: WPP domain-interacting protein 1-like [Phalaenopsis equestris]
MDLEDAKSVEGEKGRETANNLLPSKEIRADSYDEVASEELHNLVDTTESGFTDPAVSVLGTSATAANPFIDDTILAEPKEFNCNSSHSSPSDMLVVESKPVVTKGSGLRKWRRIKRDLKKDGSSSSSADSAQILKRRLSNSEPFKSDEENKLKSMADGESEESVASVASRNADINPLPVGTGSLDLELERLATGGFSIGVDSDNSEDHSSKSSTATSAPRLRHEMLASGKERGRQKNFGARSSTRLGLQKVQQDRGATVDASKKTNGDLARFEKENSFCSVESDLRSSAAGVALRGSVGNSNGKHNGRPLNFGEHGDEAHTGEEVRLGYYKENGEEVNPSREVLDAELLAKNNRKSENLHSSSDLDPFLNSMVLLEEAQESLDKEIEKIAAIRKENDDNGMNIDGKVPCDSQIFEAYLVDLREKAEHLESRLENASTVIETKEQKLQELEALLGKTQLPNKEGTSFHVSPIEVHKEELDSELEVLLKEKMETEIEYLIISRTLQNWKVLYEDRIALFKEQKYLAGDQEQMMLKLREAEDKIIMLNEQKDKLEAYCKELVQTENVLRLQNKVCKLSLYVIFQLMFLSIAFVLFLMQLLSPVDGVVPT